MDLRAVPWRSQFPIAVDVAVPIEPAAKARLLVGFDEINVVGFAQPTRQRSVGRGIAQKSLAVLDEQRGRRIGKSAPEQCSHRQTNITLELTFGNAGGLKILPIEVADAAFPQRIERPSPPAEGWGHAEAHDGREH